MFLGETATAGDAAGEAGSGAAQAARADAEDGITSKGDQVGAETQTRRTAAVVQSEWRTGIENERATLCEQEATAKEGLASLNGQIALLDKILDMGFARRGNGDEGA